MSMDIKLNRGYAAPETSLVRVRPESGICAGSNDPIVEDKNTETSIDRQGGDDFSKTTFEWDD